MRVTNFGIALTTAFLLTACGGGGGGDKDTTLYSLGGTISGLEDEGSLTLKAANQTLTINANGSFNFPNDIAENTQITLSLSNTPFRQQCAIDSDTQFVLSSNIKDIKINCAALGVLTGNVNNYHTGSAIAQAQVTISASDSDGNLLMSASTQTDSSGAFRIEGLGVSDRFILNAWSEGFGTRSEVFTNSAAQPDVNRSTLVLRANYSDSFAANEEANLAVDGSTLVSLPADAFVDANGNPVSGTIVPTITIIDPSGDASVMPGNYEVLNPDTGAINLMESFGALDANFRDEAGNLLQLAPGKSATISIPLASRIAVGSAPATVPLFYFDEQRGYWLEEGEATLTEVDGKYVYRGTVTHFTTWNADIIYETVNLSGCVKDADNNALANARIVASGRDYIGQSVGYSNAAGEFTLPVRKSSTILLTSVANSQSDTAIINTSTADLTIENCLTLASSSATVTLTWGEHPSDLDSHLFIPDASGSYETELYFMHRSVEVDGAIFDLDVDDTTSFGPEVVTIPNFPHAGTYRYLVYRYAGIGTIAESPARVELNLRGTTYVFSPDDATGNNTLRVWHVFNIVVDSAGNAQMVPVQQFSSSKSPESQAAVARKITSEPAEALPTKYYAE